MGKFQADILWEYSKLIFIVNSKQRFYFLNKTRLITASYLFILIFI